MDKKIINSSYLPLKIAGGSNKFNIYISTYLFFGGIEWNFMIYP